MPWARSCAPSGRSPQTFLHTTSGLRIPTRPCGKENYTANGLKSEVLPRKTRKNTEYKFRVPPRFPWLIEKRPLSRVYTANGHKLPLLLFVFPTRKTETAMFSLRPAASAESIAFFGKHCTMIVLFSRREYTHDFYHNTSFSLGAKRSGHWFISDAVRFDSHAGGYVARCIGRFRR